MRAVGTDIEPMADIFPGQEAAEGLILPAATVAVRRTQYDPHFPDGGIAGIGNKIYRIIKIDLVVIEAVREGTDIENAAHGKAIARISRVAESEIGGMISSEAASGDGHPGASRLVAGAGHHFFQQHAVIQALIPGAFMRRDGFIVPAQCVDAVGAIDLDLAILQVPPGRFDQTLVFILIVTPFGSREEEEGIAAMPEYQHFKIPSEYGRMPFMIFFLEVHITKLTKNTHMTTGPFALFLGDMQVEKSAGVLQEKIVLGSAALGRDVLVDLYWPIGVFRPEELSLLLINDGQDLERLGMQDILDGLLGQDRLSPLVCAGIHAGPERKMEYGTASTADYLGRGVRAGAYTDFIFKELLPHLYQQYGSTGFKEKAFAGFSLGALSAMDIVWHHPQEFSKAGLLSGSFWWRTRDKNDPAYTNADRIIHREVREGKYAEGLKFFFECGTEDEKEDRNGNGIIDSIDDTRDLINELVAKGYDPQRDIHYLEITGGRHEIATWAQVMPLFLEWGWGKKP